jgi:hypothetical protein
MVIWRAVSAASNASSLSALNKGLAFKQGGPEVGLVPFPDRYLEVKARIFQFDCAISFPLLREYLVDPGQLVDLWDSRSARGG